MPVIREREHLCSFSKTDIFRVVFFFCVVFFLVFEVVLDINKYILEHIFIKKGARLTNKIEKNKSL
jgi:hypothetical protein